jgi:hypothetical protein
MEFAEDNNTVSQEDIVEIASTIPYFPFKGIDRFYDISGILAQPLVFQVTNYIAIKYTD